jgi:hypothetical protein
MKEKGEEESSPCGHELMLYSKQSFNNTYFPGVLHPFPFHSSGIT